MSKQASAIDGKFKFVPKEEKKEGKTMLLGKAPEKGDLLLELVEAVNLPATDRGGTADPYVELHLPKESKKSKVIMKTLSPQWRELFNFNDVSLQDELSFEIFDMDIVQDQLLGNGTVALSKLQQDAKAEPGRDFATEQWLLLENCQSATAKIHFKFTFKYAKVEGTALEEETDEVENEPELGYAETGAELQSKGAVNDRPEGEDCLDYLKYATVLARVLYTTPPPLTVGLYALWGTGKSYLLSLLQRSLEELSSEKSCNKSGEKKLTPTCFRRWSYTSRWIQTIRLAKSEEEEDDSNMGLHYYYSCLKQLICFPFQLFFLCICCPFRWCKATCQEKKSEPGWLDPFEEKELTKNCFVQVIPFNAWLYSGTDNLWAGLATTLFEAVEEYYGSLTTRLFRLSIQGSVFGTIRSIILFLALVTFVIAITLQQYTQDDGASKPVWYTLGGLGVLFIGFLTGPFYELLQSQADNLKKELAKKDFSDQLGFMYDIKQEIEIVSKMMKTLPKYGDTRSLRFVFFVDDLDRCPPEKTVQVLQALVLLFSDTDAPFQAVLAIDPRMIISAIESTMQTTSFGQDSKFSNYGGKVVNGYEYLDKIVQLPFCLPAVTSDQKVLLVRNTLPPHQRFLATMHDVIENPNVSLLGSIRFGLHPDVPSAMIPYIDGDEHKPTRKNFYQWKILLNEEEKKLLPGRSEKSRTLLDDVMNKFKDTFEYVQTEREKEIQLTRRKSIPKSTPVEPSSSPSPNDPKMVEMVPIEKKVKKTYQGWLTPEENKLFSDYARFIDANPRRIKRILNVYNVTRELLEDDPEKEKLRKITLTLIVLSEQWPYKASWLLQEWEDMEQEKERWNWKETKQSNINKSSLSMETKKQTFATVRELWESIESLAYDKNAPQEVHHLWILDSDYDMFLFFLDVADLSIEHFGQGSRYVYNLNPALRRQVGLFSEQCRRNIRQR